MVKITNKTNGNVNMNTLLLYVLDTYI